MWIFNTVSVFIKKKWKKFTDWIVNICEINKPGIVPACPLLVSSDSLDSEDGVNLCGIPVHSQSDQLHGFRIFKNIFPSVSDTSEFLNLPFLDCQAIKFLVFNERLMIHVMTNKPKTVPGVKLDFCYLKLTIYTFELV